MPSEVPKTPLRFILHVSKPYRLFAVVCSAFVVLAAGTDALEPIIYKKIVDTFLAGGVVESATSIWFWVGAYFTALVSSLLFWHFTAYFGGIWLSGARATSRTVLTEYLFRHSHNYFENRFAGSTANKIAHASDGVRNMVSSWFYDIFHFVISMTAGMAVAFYANFIIGCIFVVWLLTIIPINYFFSKRRLPLTVTSQALETKLRGMSVDIVSNIRAVHEFATHKHEIQSLGVLIKERRAAGLKNFMYGRYVILLNGFIQIGFVAAIVYTTAILASDGVVSAGTVVLVLALCSSMSMRFFSLGSQMMHLAEEWGEIQEGLDDILLRHDINAEQGNKENDIIGREIKFSDVTFSYDADEVLRNFTLAIAAGERVGFVGKSGAGKSTLVKLLLRHYDIGVGSILIGDVDISRIPLDTLREHIAVIPQESNLFHRSIKDNISYGKSEATMEEVQNAAKLAQAHEFIASLPKGYDTLVGERGVKLSGGQRQRVAIARAILKNAPILVLDEATSALDSESEVAIQKALHELMEGKTVIAIAHRLSTLREMDRIIVLDEGKIAEEGTHEELVKSGGIYARLWEHQAGGFLQD